MPECQENSCSKQAQYLKFKWLQRHKWLSDRLQTKWLWGRFTHETFVEENNWLSRERDTVFTQVCKGKDIKQIPQFAFSGTGRGLHSVRSGIKYWLAAERFYRLDQLLATERNLPNWTNMLSHLGCAIFVFNKYLVLLMPEMRKSLWKKSLSFIFTGGGRTDISKKTIPTASRE